MNNRIKLLLVSIMVLGLAAVGISSYKANANLYAESKVGAQEQDRIVVDKSRSDAPVKITLIRTKKRILGNNKKIIDDNEWLQGLTIRIVNRSDKPVTYVGVQLLFRRTEDQESGLPAVWPFSYGSDPFGVNPGDSIPPPKVEPIPAGGATEIRLSESEYKEMKTFLGSVSFPASRKRLELDVIKIGFSDETAWNNGQLFRRDPNSMSGPLKGWRPLGDPAANDESHLESLLPANRPEEVQKCFNSG